MHAVTQLLDEYAAYLAAIEGAADSTVVTYRSAAASFQTWLNIQPESRDVTSASRADVEGFISSLTARGLAPRTRALTIHGLRSFYAWLPGATTNPAAKIPRPRIPPSHIRPYEPQEVDAIFAAIRGRHAKTTDVDEPVIATLYYTGLRCAELVGLEHGHLDLDARRLLVTGKNRNQRTVPIAWPLKRILASYLEKSRCHAPTSNWVFVNPRSTASGPWVGRLAPGVVRKLVLSYGQAAKVADQHHPHRWRHTFATTVLRAGIDVHTVQRLLGHIKVGTTAG